MALLLALTLVFSTAEFTVTNNCHRFGALVESFQQHAQTRSYARKHLHDMDAATREAVENALEFIANFETMQHRTPGYYDAFEQCLLARRLGLKRVLCCGYTRTGGYCEYIVGIARTHRY